MKKYIAAGAAVVLLLFVIVIGARSCAGKSVDAAGYVQADLDLIFQGETKGAKEFLGASHADLDKVYDNGISAFVQNYLTGGADTQGQFSATYEYLVKEIFRCMKYQVGEAKETEEGTYEVPVTYCPVNVFTTFIPELKEEAARIEKDAADGKYEGTDEEIKKSMLLDYMTHSYTLLESAYLDMEYGEREEFVFTVHEKDGLPAMEEEEISRFIERILELDKL
ncbi:MAG: hypothetical protein HFG41_13460 [Coprococcus sp.]|nr:hypothetical protein [Coprococcus sp.]